MKLTKLQQTARQSAMSASEKAAMRAQLFGVPSHVATPSPYVVFNFSFALRAVAAVLVFILVGGGGVAYASEGSLPGEALYAVKVNVVEPVQIALATTPQAKAAVYVQLAQTRVEEAQALASQGRLDATTSAELTQNLDAEVAAATTTAAEVAVADPAAATDITQTLSASLETNGAILAQVGDGDGTSTKQASHDFASRVLARARAIGAFSEGSSTVEVAIHTGGVTPSAVSAPTQAPRGAAFRTAVATSGASTSVEVSAASAPSANTEATGTEPGMLPPRYGQATTSASADADLTELMARAQNALADAQKKYDDAKPSLSTSTTAELDQRFAQAQTQISDGSSALNAGNQATAQADFIGALRAAAELSALVGAQQDYGPSVAPLLKLNLNVLGGQ